MALYLGSSGDLKVILNNVIYRVNLLGLTSVVNNGWLLSSDNYILTDSNGIYLIPRDYTEIVIGNILLSSDNYILTDSNGVYLNIKESE